MGGEYDNLEGKGWSRENKGFVVVVVIMVSAILVLAAWLFSIPPYEIPGEDRLIYHGTVTDIRVSSWSPPLTQFILDGEDSVVVDTICPTIGIGDDVTLVVGWNGRVARWQLIDGTVHMETINYGLVEDLD